MGIIYTDSNYSYSGRRRKRAKAKGEVYRKYTPPPFKPLQQSNSYARSRLDEAKQYNSVDSMVHSTAKPVRQEYTGEQRLLGIATMHKSNMVPIFDSEHAKDVAKMRRN